MSFCRKCGQQIDDAAFCPKCGAKQSGGEIINVSPNTVEEDKAGFASIAISLLIPIIGAIISIYFFIVGKNKAAATCFKATLIGFVIGIILLAL